MRAGQRGVGMPRDWPLAAAERARVRTEVGRDMFTTQYGRPPKDPRELSSFIARHSRAATTAVAGFDLTFTPVKSVSALWAIAPVEVAEQIQAAHRAAVADVLAWLEREAIYTRGGHAGVQQLDTTGKQPRSSTATRALVTRTYTPTSRSPRRSGFATVTAPRAGGWHWTGGCGSEPP